MTKFTTKDSEKDKHVGDDYFLESGSDVRFFFEEGAIGEDGQSAIGGRKGRTRVRARTDCRALWVSRQVAPDVYETNEHQQDRTRTALSRSGLSGLHLTERAVEAGRT